jgi:hypothetical protein
LPSPAIWAANEVREYLPHSGHVKKVTRKLKFASEKKENEMSILRRAVMAIGGMTVVALVIALAAPKAAHGIVATLVQVVNSPLSPTKPSDLVTIQTSFQSCNGTPWKALDQQMNPDGTLSPFTIPAGQVLVVTGVDFVSRRTGSAGHSAEFFLFPSAANINVNNLPIVDTMAPGNSDGQAGASIAVTGVAIKAGTPCWGLNDISSMGAASVLVHGFLTAER